MIFGCVFGEEKRGAVGWPWRSHLFKGSSSYIVEWWSELLFEALSHSRWYVAVKRIIYISLNTYQISYWIIIISAVKYVYIPLLLHNEFIIDWDNTVIRAVIVRLVIVSFNRRTICHRCRHGAVHAQLARGLWLHILLIDTRKTINRNRQEWNIRYYPQLYPCRNGGAWRR